MVLLLVSVSCATDQTYLLALLDDPMAEYDHPDLTIAFRTNTPENSSFAGFESSARVTAIYKVERDAGLRDLHRATIRYAESVGWEETSNGLYDTSVGESWQGAKQLEPGRAVLSVSYDEKDHEISVSLQFSEFSGR